MSIGFFSLKKICETHSNKKSDCLWEQVRKPSSKLFAPGKLRLDLGGSKSSSRNLAQSVGTLVFFKAGFFTCFYFFSMGFITTIFHPHLGRFFFENHQKQAKIRGFLRRGGSLTNEVRFFPQVCGSFFLNRCWSPPFWEFPRKP